MNDAFTGGGAQQRGGQRGFAFELASDLDYVRGAHSWRTGALIEGGSFTSDDITNYLGTYTFASLADYEAERPSQWSRRTGDPNLTYSTWQTALYVQDDWRIARSLLLTGGLRYGVQSHVSDAWNLSPRATFAWSPLRSGNLTIRGSYGYFYDWIAGDLYKQTLLFDGVRQREINIVNPSYPIPGETGVTPPTNRYLWNDDPRAADRASREPRRRAGRVEERPVQRDLHDGLGARPAARPQPQCARGRRAAGPRTGQ